MIATGEGTAPERLRGLIIEQLRIITVEYPELSRLFLAHLEWPAAVRGPHRGLAHPPRRRLQVVIDEGVKTGELAPLTSPWSGTT